MKKILILFVLVLSLFSIISCKKPEDNNNTNTNNNNTNNNNQTNVIDKLDNPVLSVDNNTIKWDKIANANKYIIYVDNNQYAVIRNNLYTFTELLNGTYKVYVEAVYESHRGVISSKSITINLEIKNSSVVVTKLDKPVLKINETIVSWSIIKYATSYDIYVNDEKINSTKSNFYDFKEFAYGEYEIFIEAIYEDENNKIISQSDTIILKLVEKTNDDKVNIFMINDTHGSFINTEFPGLSKVGTLIDELENANGEYIKVLNGDALQGSYVSSTQYGRPIIDALNIMEFDAFVIGNHEFDWGLDKIAAYKDGDSSNGEANFPFLGANIIDKRTGQRVSWIEPYTIVENNGSKVGIIGAIGHYQESSILTENVVNYDFVYPLEIIKTLAKELRNNKECDSVIVSVHDFDETLHEDILNLPNESSVDAILCAHYHQNKCEVGVRTDGRNVPIIQNRDKNQTASDLVLFLNRPNNESFKFTRKYPSDYNDDAEVMKVVDKYQSIIDESNKVLGYTSNTLYRNELGTYAANAMKEEFSADLGIINSGGVRADINPGNITVSDVFEVFPFNNEVIVIEIKGSLLFAACDGNSFIYSSGFDLGNIDLNKTYKVALVDYVYTHPLNEEFRNGDFIDTNILVRDLTLEYIDEIF